MIKETSCVWRSGCAAPIQCAVAGHCLRIPKDLADTQTEVRPSKDVVQRCPHGISLTACPPCHFCEHERLLNGLESLKGAYEALRSRFAKACGEVTRLTSALASIGEYDCPGGVHPKNCLGCAACDANEALSESSAHETSAPVWKRMRNQVPANGTWIWWDYGKGPMLQRAQDFASEDDGYWIEATPPLRSPEEPKERQCELGSDDAEFGMSEHCAVGKSEK